MNNGIKKISLFSEIKRLCPSFNKGGTEIIGNGWGGLVIDHKDGTVSKAFFNHVHPRMPASHRKNDRNYIAVEAQNLMLLSDASFYGFDTPRLVEEPLLFEAGATRYFRGVIRMTHLKGEPLSWHDILKKTTEAERTSHFEQAGELLARFHAYGKKIPHYKMHKPDSTWATGFKTSQKFSDETNELMKAAKSYHEDHAIPGFSHADYAGHNIMRSGNRITGLIDFSFSGYMPSFLYDFRSVPDEGGAAESFIAGYERAGGTKVDRVMVKIAESNDLAGWLSWMEQNNPEKHTEQWNALHKKLQEKLAAVKDSLLP